MKRIIIGMIACICAITVMAQVQTHDVKGVVFDRRQQPIVGALVTAKGTNISTITDVDGKFLLQEVPLSVKKVVVTSIGMETREVDLNVPVQLKWDMNSAWVSRCVCRSVGLFSLPCKSVITELSSMPKDMA